MVMLEVGVFQMALGMILKTGGLQQNLMTEDLL